MRDLEEAGGWRVTATWSKLSSQEATEQPKTTGVEVMTVLVVEELAVDTDFTELLKISASGPEYNSRRYQIMESRRPCTWEGNVLIHEASPQSCPR